jgi:hypothetical protein
MIKEIKLYQCLVKSGAFAHATYLPEWPAFCWPFSVYLLPVKPFDLAYLSFIMNKHSILSLSLLWYCRA